MSRRRNASEKEAPSQQNAFGSAFWRLVALQSAFGVSFSAFLLLPKFLRTELQASASEIGWMSGISLAAAAIASPFVGWWLGRTGRRRLLLLALALESIAALSFLLVTHVGPLALLLRTLQGLAFVLVFNCTASWIADMTPGRVLARALGYLGTALLVTNALAPLVMEPLSQALGWPAVFVTAGVVAAATPLLLIGLREPSRVDPSMKLQTPHRPSALRSTSPILYGSLMMGAGIGVMFTFVQPYALQQGAVNVGQMFLGYAVAAASVRLLFGGVADRIGPAKMAGLSLTAYSLTVFATAAVTPETLILSGVGLGVAHGFLYPALSAAGLQAMSGTARSLFLGWFSCAFNSGFALTVLLLGPLADRFGYPAVFMTTGLALASAVVPTFRFRSRSDSCSPATS